jgi:hypothetical protein
MESHSSRERFLAARSPPPPPPPLPSESWDSSCIGIDPIVLLSEHALVDPPTPVAQEPPLSDDPRIPTQLRRYVGVGMHGGLVLTPFTILSADPADACLDDAYHLVADHAMGVADTGKSLVANAPPPLSSMRIPLASEEHEQSSSAASSTNDASSFASPLAQERRSEFSWLHSHSRKIVVDFGRSVRAEREKREIEERAEAVAAIATAAAATGRAVDDKPPDRKPVAPPLTAAESAQDDPIVWIAQEEAAVAQTLRAVRLAAQQRSGRFGGVGGSGGTVGGGINGTGAGSMSGGGEESSIWGFLMPRSSKMRPEAAAEMARARVAAAAAAAAMRDDVPEVPRVALDSSGISTIEKYSEECASTDAGDASSSRRAQSDDSYPALGAAANAKLDIDKEMLELDDATLLARMRGLSLQIPQSPVKNPGFPRALSLGLDRGGGNGGGNSGAGSVAKCRPDVPEGFKMPKKKRVTFNSQNNSVHNFSV